MKKILFALFVIPLLISGCNSKLKLNIKKHIAAGNLNEVIYYVASPDKINYEKVLIFIRGTGRFKASHDFGMGAEASLFGYSIVYPQKSYINDKEEYYIHDNREQRVHDTKTIIDDLIKKGTKNILILADSEGTMLAPEITKDYSNYVTGLICMGGSVFSFENDLLYNAVANKGVVKQIAPAELSNIFNDIYSDSNNVKKDFLGHSYKFWSSYLKYEPINDLKKIKCPILYLNGEYDELNINNQQKKIIELYNSGINIKQIVYGGIGHKMKNINETLINDILDWAKENKIF